MPPVVPDAEEKSSWKALGAALTGAVFAGLGALLFALFDGWSTTLSKVVWESAPWAVFLIMPAGLALILWLRDRVFPWTDGTGIPQVIAVLQAGPGELRERLLSGRIIAGNKTLEAWADIEGDVQVVQTDGQQLVVVQRTDLDLTDDEGAARKLAYYDNRAKWGLSGTPSRSWLMSMRVSIWAICF